MKHLKYLESQKDIKNFFANIKEGKMKIIVVHEPKVAGSDTSDNPKNVTDQYLNFRQKFYDIVTKDLRAAKVPALEAPGMSESEIRKCE